MKRAPCNKKKKNGRYQLQIDSLYWSPTGQYFSKWKHSSGLQITHYRYTIATIYYNDWSNIGRGSLFRGKAMLKLFKSFVMSSLVFNRRHYLKLSEPSLPNILPFIFPAPLFKYSLLPHYINILSLRF